MFKWMGKKIITIYANKTSLSGSIDKEILQFYALHSRRVVVSYKRKYVHELLVNRLFKPAQEKVWLGELTVPQ